MSRVEDSLAIPKSMKDLQMVTKRSGVKGRIVSLLWVTGNNLPSLRRPINTLFVLEEVNINLLNLYALEPSIYKTCVEKRKGTIIFIIIGY